MRSRLVEALKLDLVGPWAGHELAEEKLPGWVRPSNWYLTGFLIPSGTPPEKSGDADEDDDLGEIPESAGLSEESNEERKTAKKGFFPSSMGLSFLVRKEANSLDVTVRWGDYARAEIENGGAPVPVWQRYPREATCELVLTGASDPLAHDVPDSDGLQIHVVERPIASEDLAEHIPEGTRSVSVFLVNHRSPAGEGEPDLTYAFQAEVEVRSEQPFVSRPDLRGISAEDWDEQVADLHYADTPAYATGHGVSAEWEIVDGKCHLLRTAWIPSAEVEKTATVNVSGVELSMEALGALTDGSAVERALRPLVTEYRTWIETRRSDVEALQGARRETAEELLHVAKFTAGRIERGIALLARDEDALGYFNSLRELGGARRILEEEVQNTIKAYGARKRIGEERGLFQDRKTFSEVVELTSRVSTDKVAEARRRLECWIPRCPACGLCDRNEHDLGRPRHPAARADGRPRSTEDPRRVYPGHESRGPRRRAAGARRDALQYSQAAGPLPLRALPALPRDLLSFRRGGKRDPFFCARTRPGLCRSARGIGSPRGGRADAAAGSREDRRCPADASSVGFSTLFSGACVSSPLRTKPSERSGCAACRTGLSICSIPGARCSMTTGPPGWRCSTRSMS